MMIQKRSSLPLFLSVLFLGAVLPLSASANGARAPKDPQRPSLWKRLRNRLDQPRARSSEVFVTQTEIVSDFTLIDSEGIPLAIRKAIPATEAPSTPENSFEINTGVAPLESARALCGDPDVTDEARMNEQSRVREGLLDLILRLEATEGPRSLNNEEVALLTQTPLCEPYIAQLQTITRFLKDSSGGIIASPGNPATRFTAMIFRNERNRKAQPPVTGALVLEAEGRSLVFRLQQAITFNRKGMPTSLENYNTPASLTGQNMGVEVRLLERLQNLCQSDYELNFVSPTGSLLAKTRFTVHEVRCK